jgi:hypothetical protein
MRGEEVIPSRQNSSQRKDRGKNKKREEVIPSRHNLVQRKDRGETKKGGRGYPF